MVDAFWPVLRNVSGLAILVWLTIYDGLWLALWVYERFFADPFKIYHLYEALPVAFMQISCIAVVMAWIEMVPMIRELLSSFD